MRSNLLMSFLCVFLTGISPSLAEVPEEPEFEPSGQLWGYVFGDFFYKVLGNDDWGNTQYAQVQKHMYAGQLRRLYLGYRYDLTPTFRSAVLLESNDRSSFANGAYGVFIKQAFLQWTPEFFDSNLVTQVGLIPTPVTAFPEKQWGYRSVEKEVLDSRQLGRSVDQGISVQGNLVNKNFGYHLMFGNGSGNKPAASSDKAGYASLYGRFFEEVLSLEVMFNHDQLPDQYFRNVSRAFLGINFDSVVFGASAAYGFERNLVLDGGRIVEDLEQVAASVFASATIPKTQNILRVFGRFDHYNPDLSFSVTKAYPEQNQFYNENLIIAGLDIRPIPDVRLMPNVWVNMYEPKDPTVEERPSDVVLRLTFFYTFGT